MNCILIKLLKNSTWDILLAFLNKEACGFSFEQCYGVLGVKGCPTGSGGYQKPESLGKDRLKSRIGNRCCQTLFSSFSRPERHHAPSSSPSNQRPFGALPQASLVRNFRSAAGSEIRAGGFPGSSVFAVCAELKKYFSGPGGLSLSPDFHLPARWRGPQGVQRASRVQRSAGVEGQARERVALRA